MPTRADVERLRAANREIARFLRTDLEQFWGSLDLGDPTAARWALLEYMPVLVERYGEIAAAVSAEWYDEMRAAAGAYGTYRALPAPHVIVEQVRRATGWAARNIIDADRTLSDLSGASTRIALQVGRETISSNARREGVRWARIPTGDETCAFCLMLASRGFAYHSEADAQRRGARQLHDKYHDWCDCVPTPSWSRDGEHIEGYDPDALYRIYERARGDISNANDVSGVLSRLRQQQGIN